MKRSASSDQALSKRLRLPQQEKSDRDVTPKTPIARLFILFSCSPGCYTRCELPDNFDPFYESEDFYLDLEAGPQEYVFLDLTKIIPVHCRQPLDVWRTQGINVWRTQDRGGLVALFGQLRPMISNCHLDWVAWEIRKPQRDKLPKTLSEGRKFDLDKQHPGVTYSEVTDTFIPMPMCDFIFKAHIPNTKDLQGYELRRYLVDVEEMLNALCQEILASVPTWPQVIGQMVTDYAMPQHIRVPYSHKDAIDYASVNLPANLFTEK